LSQLQRRHEQRQEQRRLGNAASLALTIALGKDEKLRAKIGPDKGQEKLAALKPEAQGVSESYLEAAGLYLESLKVMEASERENNLAAGRPVIAVKRRVEEILDRVDQLKNGKLAR
jgi:CRISPR/Cas system CMR-associated protein Cmr5 small subunit